MGRILLAAEQPTRDNEGQTDRQNGSEGPDDFAEHCAVEADDGREQQHSNRDGAEEVARDGMIEFRFDDRGIPRPLDGVTDCQDQEREDGDEANPSAISTSAPKS